GTVAEVSCLNHGRSVEDVRLTLFDTSHHAYVNFSQQFGNSYRYGPGTNGWSRDTRDSLITTRAGTLMRFTDEIAGGDLQYARIGYQHQWYYPLTRRLTFLPRGQLGLACGLGA